jgi:hypothetical protein
MHEHRHEMIRSFEASMATFHQANAFQSDRMEGLEGDIDKQQATVEELASVV